MVTPLLKTGNQVAITSSVGTRVMGVGTPSPRALIVGSEGAVCAPGNAESARRELRNAEVCHASRPDHRIPPRRGPAIARLDGGNLIVK